MDDFGEDELYPLPEDESCPGEDGSSKGNALQNEEGNSGGSELQNEEGKSNCGLPQWEEGQSNGHELQSEEGKSNGPDGRELQSEEGKSNGGFPSNGRELQSEEGKSNGHTLQSEDEGKSNLPSSGVDVDLMDTLVIPDEEYDAQIAIVRAKLEELEDEAKHPGGGSWGSTE